jgi:hypothetical protein
LFENSAERKAYQKKQKMKLKKKKYKERKKLRELQGNKQQTKDPEPKELNKDQTEGKEIQGDKEETKAEVKALPEEGKVEDKAPGGGKKRRRKRNRIRKKKNKQTAEPQQTALQVEELLYQPEEIPQDDLLDEAEGSQQEEEVELEVEEHDDPIEEGMRPAGSYSDSDDYGRSEDYFNREDRSQPLSPSEDEPKNPHKLNGAVKPSVVQHLPVIDENIKIKIADLGNACWIDHHFSSEIQTRQYRSPEVILGVSYNASADIWSCACMIFELATGDFMFDPKGGPEFGKEDDHLAQMIEAIGKMPKAFALSGSQSKKFFNKRGELFNVKKLKFWPLREVLMEKYGFKDSEAKAFSEFLKLMLEFQPERRASAEECLRHSWLTLPSEYNTKMSEEEYAGLMERLDMKQAELKVRVMRGEDLSSPETPREGSAWEGDVEDNSEPTDSDSEAEADAKPVFEEVTEYHERMAQVRALLLA